MAKSQIVKFPRVEAGFYTVTFDGELVGYVAKKVEGKETTWSVYNTNEPDLTIETLPPSALVEESELFREAKEAAKTFFMNLPEPQEESEPEVEIVELQVPDWSEEDSELEFATADLQTSEWSEEGESDPDFFDELNDYEEAEAELVGV